MKKQFILILFLVFFATVGMAHSQSTNLNESLLFDQSTGLPVGIEEQISIQIVPRVPRPKEQVTISIESFSTDLSKAQITWTQDGKTAQTNRGQKNFTFFAPQSGSSTTIRVLITKEGGGVLSKTFTVAPAEVDIIYEALTYTPPYYKGKALFTSESQIRFVAMPNFETLGGSTLDPENLTYTWSINGTVLDDASGFGKRTLEIQSGIIQREMVISVEVAALNSNLKASGEISIDDVPPEILLYENNPLLGLVFERATSGGFTLKRPEVELQAIPYFFSTPQKENGFLNYKWRVNGKIVEEGKANSFVRFRNETGEEGRANISVEVEHGLNILQAGRVNFDLKFEEHEEIIQDTFEF